MKVLQINAVSGRGYVVECGDIYAIADKCEEIHKTGKGAYSMHCSSTVSARFDKKTLINETVKTYKKLLELSYMW